MQRPRVRRVLGRQERACVAGKGRVESRGPGHDFGEQVPGCPRSTQPYRVLGCAPHPTWRPRGTRPRDSGSAYRRAPEVESGPPPAPGLCGASDAPALSIPGQPGGRPRSCGSGGSRSSRPRHGQHRRGTAGACLYSPPCLAALVALGPPHPDSGFPASFPSRSLSRSILPVLTSAGSQLPILTAAAALTPTLTSAWLGPSYPYPGLGLAPSFPSLLWPCHLPLAPSPILDPSRPLAPYPVSEGISSLNFRFSIRLPVPHS